MGLTASDGRSIKTHEGDKSFMAARKSPSRGSKPDKLWRDALMVVVNRAAEKGKATKKLAKLAEKCVEMGMAGEIAAIKEIGDRLDGRAHQPITGGDGGAPKLIVELVDPTK